MATCGRLPALPGSRGTWVRLCLCQSCGWVACSGDSPGQHAKAHCEQTGHPVVILLHHPHPDGATSTGAPSDGLNAANPQSRSRPGPAPSRRMDDLSALIPPTGRFRIHTNSALGADNRAPALGGSFTSREGCPVSAVLIRPGRCRSYRDPGCLAAVRAERHDRQGWAGTPLSGAGKPGDGGADERCLDDVVTATRSRRAVPLAYPHLHADNHHASAPSRLTSPSSARRASCRDPLTSSVQPATCALPDHWRVWRAVARSSCRDRIEMPSASPAGTQPVITSLAKSCPDRPEVNGTACPCAAPGARPRCRWR